MKKHAALLPGRTLKVLLALMVAGVVALGLWGSRVDETAWASPDATSDQVADVVEAALPSVVNVSTTKLVSSGPAPMGSFGNRPDRRLGKSLGSGVIISSQGYVLTNNHVVTQSRDIMVGLSDGRELRATVVGADPNSDLAVLKLQGKLGKLKPITLGRSSKMRLGETVLAIGNPFGVGQTVTMGIVSAKGRANMGILDYEDFIQTDAAINPGNSGGALVNLRGELIGINTAILSRTGGSQGIGFAIPSDIARPIMKSLIRSGKVARGYLGVTIQTVNDELAETLKLGATRGVLVSDVSKGSPAARVGLRRNDVVVSINSVQTLTSAQLRTKVASLGAGSKIEIEVMRGKERLSLDVKLDELPTRKVTSSGGGDDSAGDAGFGVSVASLTRRARDRYELPDRLDHGVVVTGVTDGSRGAEIGLLPGDVILEVNRSKVKTTSEFTAAYSRSSDRLALLVFRDGSAVYIVVNK